jgi:hypothetical protein
LILDVFKKINKIKKGNEINDSGCEILNEILLENKKIEIINLNCKKKKIKKKVNEITAIGYYHLKESILKNKNLKKLYLRMSYHFYKNDILNKEYEFVYKLIKLTQKDINFDFSKNIYLFQLMFN